MNEKEKMTSKTLFYTLCHEDDITPLIEYYTSLDMLTLDFVDPVVINEHEIKMLTRFGDPVNNFQDADIVIIQVTREYSKQEWEEFMKQNPELFINQKTK